MTDRERIENLENENRKIRVACRKWKDACLAEIDNNVKMRKELDSLKRKYC